MALRFPRFVVLLTTALLWGGAAAAPAAPAAPAAGNWPAVPQQLAKDRVQPGSALEKLILANQDFKLLRADEAHDQLALPPWLRVFWRKAHPEAVYSADDPTGGYPLVLKEMHEWMLHHQDLLPGKEEETIRPGTPGKVVAGPNLRISGAQTTPRSESDIRVNYWDGTKIIAASNNISASGRQAQFWSTDGGGTWGQTTLPLVVGDNHHSDPTVDWISNSTAWATTLGITSGGQLRLRVYSSADFGATWTSSATASGTQTNVDKQMIWVDHSASSPYQNNIYAIWHNGLPAFMNVRNAGTGLWGTPTQVSTAAGTGTQIGGDVKTNSAGHVFGFWPATGNRRVFVVKSTDGGGTYGAPVILATTFDAFDIGVPSFNSRRILIYVSGGAWRQTTINGTKDLVYASWTDLTGAVGCTAAANEPGANAASTCKTRIWFTRSTDGGTTWEAPRMINNQAGLNDQFNQWLVVDETTGQLAIAYQDTVADANRLCTHVYYQASFDDGVTWTVPFQVSTAQTCEAAAGADAGNQYGDYNGLSGYARNFFPSWTDRRNNAREEIWTAGLNDARTDVWSQDKPWDTGLEPDPATAANNMWESEDIWVRPDATAGPHVDPEAGSVNYVHVNVRNRSASVPAENVPVKLYFAHASSGLAWPTDWTLIGTTVLPSVPVGVAPVDAVFQWTPPAEGHYCLLARLDTAQDPMTNAETGDVNYNTRFNNNIAWRNVNVVDLVKSAVFKGSFILRNSFHEAGRFRLVLRARENERRETFLTRGRIQITLPTDLVALLERQGMVVGGKGFKKIDGQTLQMTETEAEIWVPLDKRKQFTLGFRFEDTAPRLGIGKEATRYTLEVIEETDRKEMEGGITYRIDAPVMK